METNSHTLQGILSNSEAGQKLKKRLSEESTLERLDRIVNRLDTIEKGLDKLEFILEKGPGLAAIMGDTVDEVYRNLETNGVSLDERMRNALILLDKITAKETVEKLQAMMLLADKMPGIIAMSADMFDELMKISIEKGLEPEVLAETAMVSACALSEARSKPVKKLGLFGILRSLRDPDRQKAIGFLMHFLKSFGKRI